MEKQTGRIEAFSDGIFGVAITLLALEIGIDVQDIHEKLTNDVFWHELVALWPKYVAYFNSFASVLLMWMAHHKLFQQLKRANTYTMLANGFLLLVVALVPFPTKSVGEFFFTPARDASIIFYTSYSILVSSSFCLLGLAMLSEKVQVIDPVELKGILKGVFMGILLNIAIAGISFSAPLIAMGLNFCMWIFWAILSRANEKPLEPGYEN